MVQTSTLSNYRTDAPWKDGIMAKLMGIEADSGRLVASVGRASDAGMPEAFRERFEKAARNNDPQYLWSWIESYTGVHDRETADESAKGHHDSRYAHALNGDLHKRILPKDMPSVSVEIKRLVRNVSRNGREKMGLGIVFTVNGESFPVCFGSKDQTMLYVCTLLRKKKGERMYIHEFFNNSKGNSAKARFRRGKSDKWLKAVYDAIFPFDAREFKEWIGMVNERRGHPLCQGKSQGNRLVVQTLDTQPSGAYYCTVKTKRDEISDSYYDINVSPREIIIPENLQFLLDDFDELMGQDRT